MLHNRYRLTGQLGAGAFGTVLKAEDTLLADKPVAIKRMDTQQATGAEMAMLAQLDHPHIPPVQDYFQEHNCAYLVMKYIAGETLADKMAAGQPLPLDEVLRIGLVLCDVLQYLHNQPKPIIFRDLKPENVIIAPNGHLWLIDFGIARTFKLGQSKDTYALGSDGYAPPEQYDRTQTDPRSDIYALGALMYYLLTGDDPSAHVFRFTPTLISNERVRHVIAQCTQLDASRRYDSASTVADRLRICQQCATASVFPGVQPPVTQVTATPAPTRVLPASSPTTGRSILWIYAKEDEKIVRSLETHLAMVRRNYGLTFLHNKQEYTTGIIRENWIDAIQRSFIVGIIHSPYFWGSDDLVATWESLIYPTAKQYSRVIPIIGRECLGGDPSDIFKEVSLPRSGKPLNSAGDSEYAGIASEIKGLCATKFGTP